jgi:hypothetical protein
MTVPFPLPFPLPFPVPVPAVATGGLGVFFTLAAYVQLNDPSPTLQIVAFGLAALLSFFCSLSLLGIVGPGRKGGKGNAAPTPPRVAPEFRPVVIIALFILPLGLLGSYLPLALQALSAPVPPLSLPARFLAYAEVEAVRDSLGMLIAVVSMALMLPTAFGEARAEDGAGFAVGASRAPHKKAAKKATSNGTDDDTAATATTTTTAGAATAVSAIAAAVILAWGVWYVALQAGLVHVAPHCRGIVG